eukprot:1187045-Pyramimonas_sp.AAC.1
MCERQSTSKKEHSSCKNGRTTALSGPIQQLPPQQEESTCGLDGHEDGALVAAARPMAPRARGGSTIHECVTPDRTMRLDESPTGQGRGKTGGKLRFRNLGYRRETRRAPSLICSSS